MKVTINDIAERAKVSKSTVSYALSGSRPVSESVKERIKAVMKELNYAPSQAARTMRSGKTMSIGVAIDQCSNPSSGLFLEEISRQARLHGYHILLGISGGIPEESRRILEHFTTGVVDGVINCLPEISVQEAKKLTKTLPVITSSRHDPESPAEPDYEKGIIETLDYLTSLGHKKIGFISIKQRGVQFGDPCLLGFKKYCSKRHMEYDESLIEYGNGSFDSGIELGEKLYKNGATAIFSGNDRTGAGILAWAHEEGISIPEQLSVIGWDDSPLASACSPPLTSVKMPYIEIAGHTLEALLCKLKGHKFPGKILVETKLVIRRSTGIAKNI